MAAKKWRKGDHIELEREKLPRHVAIIMDGNGRWAKRRLLPRSLGHRAGMENVKSVIRQTSDLGIEALTLYAFSTENWKRPKDEVSLLMNLLIEFLEREMDELHQENVRFRAIGALEELPNDVQEVLKRATDKTADNTGLKLFVAVNYGSRDEMIAAVRQTAEDYASGRIQTIGSADFEKYLSTADAPDPDLVIRTSGEQRISNFLLYQIAYAELYFTQVFWPDFGKEEYEKALADFAGRKRRFGGL